MTESPPWKPIIETTNYPYAQLLLSSLRRAYTVRGYTFKIETGANVYTIMAKPSSAWLYASFKEQLPLIASYCIGFLEALTSTE